MRRLPLLIILLSWAALPSLVAAVELHWDPDAIENLVYKSAVEADITGELGELEPGRWIADPGAFDKIIAKLKRLPLKDEYLHYRTRLKRLDNGRGMRVKMIGVPVEFEGEAADAREAELRERIAAFTDAIMVQGDVDFSGDSTDLTFYRVPKERLTLTQLFYLPKGDVDAGDHWQIPVRFTELGPGIFAQETATYNRVTLTALRPSPAGTVAELRYLIHERASGYIERVANTEMGRPPFAIDLTVFGYGEFLVEQGYWLRQVTVADYAGSGLAKIQKQNLFALELNKERSN